MYSSFLIDNIRYSVQPANDRRAIIILFVISN